MKNFIKTSAFVLMIPVCLIKGGAKSLKVGRRTLLVCAVFGSTPVLKARFLSGAWTVAVGYAVQFVLFAVGISCLVMNAHNPFIYFNF